MPDQPMLQVEDLRVSFRGPHRTTVSVIKGVSLHIDAGETLGLVGESGSGKTTIGRAVLGLAPISSGTVRVGGRDVTRLGRRERRKVARDVQVVFQDPYSSLNPAMRVADILVEPLMTAGTEESPRARVLELLDQVGLPSDAGRRYPREFSGGQRQRIAIARALALRPRLIICDEPTSALDVTTQARILKLLEDIQKHTGTAYLFISHDLGVVHEVSDRIAVLRGGEVVEIGSSDQVSMHPRHAYTQRLQLATPVPDPTVQAERRRQRHALLGRA